METKATINLLTVQWQRKKKHEKMASTLITGNTNGSESGINYTQFHSGFDELYHHDYSGDRRGNNDDHLWVSITEVVRRQSDSLLRLIRRYNRFRFGMELNNSWKRLYFRSSNKSSQPGSLGYRNRKRNRHYLYYGLLISLLSVGPVKASEPETNNVSNPVAAATGNVTNQAVMFQNNGAPSRQHYGPNISCNGSTMTFSPFYMGNHTTPFDIDDGSMQQQNYTVAENWGFQVNFMVPLDKRGLERCRRIAARQEEKMRLDYELVRALKCSELQQKGFMLVPGSRVYSMCSDVIPISSYLKTQKPKEDKSEEKKGWFQNPFKKE